MTNLEKDFWNKRYTSGETSGAGSYGEQLAKKLKWLTGLEGVKTISEVGCGDFNFGNQLTKLYTDAEYVGLDISEYIVYKNQYFNPEHKFMVLGETYPPADLLLCVDVLFHVLDDNEVEEILRKLERAWTKYLVITAYERAEPMYNHVRIRKFDYQRFGTPIFRQVVEEDGQLYFYIFKR